MQFLYRTRPMCSELLKDDPTDDEGRIISEHFSYLENLKRDGVLILAGRTLNTDTSSHGIVVFNAASELAARKILSEDPAVKNNIFRAELFPYRVALINEKNVHQ